MINITVLATILVLGLLVFVHELGHFVVAKFMGMRVEEFAIGFGPVIYSNKEEDDETTYSLRAIPLGGFNKIAGMVESEDEVIDDKCFCRKSIAARMLTIFAGAFMNFILPIIIFFIVFLSSGIENIVDLPVVGEVMSERPAYEAGLVKGDKILSINDTKVNSWQGMSELIRNSHGEKLSFLLERNGEQQTIVVTPEYIAEKKVSLIGITPTTEIIKLGVVDSFKLAVEKTGMIIKAMVVGLSQIISGSTNAELSGPIGVIQLTSQVAQQGVIPLLTLAAFLSINLGVINLLPLPALDGGHLILLTIEGLRGKPISVEMAGRIQMAGVIILLSVMVFATFKDVSRFSIFN